MAFIVFGLSLCAGVLSFMYGFPLAASSLAASINIPDGIKAITEKLSSSIVGILGESHVMTAYSAEQCIFSTSYLIVIAGLIGVTAALLCLFRMRGTAGLLLLLSAGLCGASIYLSGYGYLHCVLFLIAAVMMFRLPAYVPCVKPADQTSGQNVSAHNRAIDICKRYRIPKRMNIRVGLGWTKSTLKNNVFDLDLSALPVMEDGRVNAEDFMYYNDDDPKTNSQGKIYMEHSGDNECGGSGRKDNERITVYLSQVPDKIKKILLTVTIKNADRDNLTFAQIRNAYARVFRISRFLKRHRGMFTRYNLSNLSHGEASVICGELLRDEDNPKIWYFRDIMHSYRGGIPELCRFYNLGIQENHLPD